MQRSIIAPAERVTNMRWGMLGLVSLFAFAMSFDGVGLVLGGWTDLNRIAVVAAALVAQLPAGLLLDRFGVRRTGFAAGVLWYLATIALDFGGSALAIPASIAIGIAGSAIVPLAAKATASWFPTAERGRATAIWVAAVNLPIVLTIAPFVSAFAAHVPRLFAEAVVLVTILFFALYRDADDPRTTYAERTYVQNGGAQPVAVPDLGPAFAALVRSRTLWAAAFGFGAFSYAFGLGAVQVWGIAWSPLALLVIVAAGFLVDAASRTGTSPDKLMLAIFTLAGTLWVGAGGITSAFSPVYASLVLFGYAVALPIAWTIPGRIAPRGAVGLVASILAIAGTLGAFLVWFTAEDALGASIAALIAALCFAFALGRIEPIADPV